MTESALSNPIASPSKAKLWLAAIKPPMYSVAVVPITVGSLAAYAQGNPWQGQIYGLFLFGAIAVIAWLNISNDVFDSDTGIDVHKAHSIVNLTGNRNAMFWLSNGFLLTGLGAIGAITWIQQDWFVLGLIALAIFLGYTYQGPPFRLGYLGLGEIICFITFGPLAISAAFYSQAQAITPAVVLPSVFVGLSTAIILFCSHFHQVEDDLAAGKRSPIVRLGTARGAKVLAVTVLSLFGTIFGGLLLGALPLSSLVVLGSLPFGIQLIRNVGQYHDQPERVSNCKFIAVNLHFVSGMLLALSYGWGAG